MYLTVRHWTCWKKKFLAIHYLIWEHIGDREQLRSIVIFKNCILVMRQFLRNCGRCFSQGIWIKCVWTRDILNIRMARMARTTANWPRWFWELSLSAGHWWGNGPFTLQQRPRWLLIIFMAQGGGCSQKVRGEACCWLRYHTWWDISSETRFFFRSKDCILIMKHPLRREEWWLCRIRA